MQFVYFLLSLISGFPCKKITLWITEVCIKHISKYPAGIRRRKNKMRKTKEIYKCEICGVYYEKFVYGRNRSKADNKSAWWGDNVMLCPDCYLEQKEAEEKAKYAGLPALEESAE